MAGNAIENQTTLGTKVELSFYCTELLDMDVFSKSDPFIVLYANTGMTIRNNAGWVKLGRTEVIYDNLNPKVLSFVAHARGCAMDVSYLQFAKTFNLDYHFEEVQHLRVAVYDVDDKKHIDDLSKHDFIGEAKFTLADVVTAGQVLTKQLTSASKYG